MLAAGAHGDATAPPAAKAEAKPAAKAPPAADPFVRVERPRGVIVPRDHAGEFWFRTDSRFGYYTPSREEVAALERKLPAVVGQLGKVRPEFVQRLAGYTRQYVGLVDGKERWIWVNFFCNAMSADWTRHLVAVDDGGDCFGTVEYQPATGRFKNFQLNGDG